MSLCEILNDDCLLHLFCFLDPEDLLTLEEVSTHLKYLTFYYYRLVHDYEWSKQRQRVNKQMIERIGGNLRRLIYRGIGSTDIECFSAVHRYCQRIDTLTLFDVTIDSNLNRLLMPVLESLKSLYIDRYLMVKQVRVLGPLNEGEEPPEEEEDIFSVIQCLMICMTNLEHLFIGEPFDKDSFMVHDYLSMMLNLKSLNLNLTRNDTFAEFGAYFGHTFLPLTSLELIFPNEGVTDYDKFCSGLINLQHLKQLKLHNLQNKHFGLLVPGIRNIKSLETLKLNCAQGVILSKAVQYLLTRIDNKELFAASIGSLKNQSFQFLYTMKWWKNLRSFEILNCDKFNNDDLLEICLRATKLISVTVKDCIGLHANIVHQLVRISKIRIYNITFNFYHQNQEIFSKFEKETERTIIQYINVNNFYNL